MPPHSETQYLDPVVLSTIGHMEVIARTVVEGAMTGLHRSPYKGASVEFTEHRPYNPGDEVRHIDWKAYAKRDRFYIKQFEEETNLRAYLLVDASGSMNYAGARRVSKCDYAKYMAASLAYLMLRQRDSPGLVVFDRALRTYIPPRGNTGHLHYIAETLSQTQPGGETALHEVLFEVAQRVSRRGLVVLISDLLDDEEAVIGSLRHLHGCRHEVVVFHVMDPDELSLPFSGKVRFREPERGREVLTNPARMRGAYARRVEAFIDRYRQGCSEHHVDYVFVRTDQPVEQVLFEYLSTRS